MPWPRDPGPVRRFTVAAFPWMVAFWALCLFVAVVFWLKGPLLLASLGAVAWLLVEVLAGIEDHERGR